MLIRKSLQCRDELRCFEGCRCTPWAHATARGPVFLSGSLFKDRNYLTGTVFIFTAGAVLYAIMALLPALLQNLLQWPVVLTGLVTAPRRLGSIAALVVVGRLLPIVDVRVIIGAGFDMSAISLWQMSNFYLQVDVWTVLYSGVLQGFGTGFIYMPFATTAFGTLPTHLRNEGTALFNLMRNLGSSVGISARHHAAGTQYANLPFAARRACHPFCGPAERVSNASTRAWNQSRRHQCNRDPTSRDDRLHHRLQVYHDPDDRSRPAGHVPAASEASQRMSAVRKSQLPLTAAMALTLAGCMVGPDFKRPDAPTAQRYTADELSPDFQDQRWTRVRSSKSSGGASSNRRH
ncbi:MAG: MFS transporter [Steroidobacteraceae bacterium]